MGFEQKSSNQQGVLMLKIIEPLDQKDYQIQIDSFLSLLTIYQNYSLLPQDWENGTFIIASDNEFGVYGGALLIQKSVYDLDQKLKQLILTFQPDTNIVWTIRIGFYREHEAHSPKIKALNSNLDFYQNLLKTVNGLGIKKRIDFLYLSMNVNEHTKLKKYGFWHNAGTVFPHESLDNHFHSILVLSRGLK